MCKKIRLFPELVEGLRIQYIDTRSATRSSVIHKRVANKITVINAVGRREKVDFKQIRGYWAKEVAYALDINITRFNSIINEIETLKSIEKVEKPKRVKKISIEKIEKPIEKPHENVIKVEKPKLIKEIKKPKLIKPKIEIKPKTEDEEMMEMF